MPADQLPSMVTESTVGDDDAAAVAAGDTGADGALETPAAERDAAGEAEPATWPHANGYRRCDDEERQERASPCASCH